MLQYTQGVGTKLSSTLPPLALGALQADALSLQVEIHPVNMHNPLTKHSQKHPVDDSENQDAKVREFRAALGPLSERSSKFCSDACLRTYLKVRNWNVNKAKIMLEETLKWRETYKPEEINWNEVAHEGEAGKIFKANFRDRFGRTVLIMDPTKPTSNDPEGTVRYFVYHMENAILSLPEDQEQVSWLVDYTGWSLNSKMSIKTARLVIHVIRSHYPERLGVAFVCNPPKISMAFWKAIRIFVDSLTYQKVKFVNTKNKDSVELMRSFFDVENLPSMFGGKATLTYNHEEYSKQMAEEDVKTANFWGIDRKIIQASGSGCTRADSHGI